MVWILLGKDMINFDNGEIVFPGCSNAIFADMSIEKFKGLGIRIDKTKDLGNGYCWYSIRGEVKDFKIGLELCFYQNRLDTLHFHTRDAMDALNWDAWTEEREMEVYWRNNRFLSKIFHRKADKVRKTPYPQSRYLFSWGEVWSVYDPRSASSFMGISWL